MLARNKDLKGLSDYLRTHQHTGGIIVSPIKKFIYMKPTKTAGSAILHGIFDSIVPDVIYKQSKTRSKEFNEWLQNVTDNDLREYFIFTVTRNPFDRFVSNASYFNIPFNELVKNYEKLWVENDNLKHHCRPIHFYSHFNGNQFADLICRYETLQFDFNIVCDQIGIQRTKIPIVNKSKHRHYSSYYDTMDKISVIERIYAEDIKYYGYELEKPSIVKQSYLYYRISNRINQFREKFLNKPSRK